MAEVFGYDDEKVTLGDGVLAVENAAFGTEKVGGSRSFVRDPRLSHLANLPPLWKPPMQMAQLPPGYKWCYLCGDVRPKSYFSPKKSAHDGLDPRCKQCENERKRQGYKEAVGREVRVYNRQEKVAV